MKIFGKVLLLLVLWLLFGLLAGWLCYRYVPIRFKLECNITSPEPVRIGKAGQEQLPPETLSGKVGQREINLRFSLRHDELAEPAFELSPAGGKFSLGEATYGLCGLEFIRLRRRDLLERAILTENVGLEIADRALQVKILKEPAVLAFHGCPGAVWAYPMAGAAFGLLPAVLAFLLLLPQGRALLRRGCRSWHANQPKVLVGAFLVMLIGPTIVYDYFPVEASSANEQRELAPPPEFRLRRIQGFPAQFSKYYRDHLPYRIPMVALNTRLMFEGGNISPARYVMTGSDGMLFFNSRFLEDNSDSLADFLHTNRYTPEQLERLKTILERVQAFCAGRGIRFALLLLPNKSTIYPERMPLVFQRNVTGESRLEQLTEYLRSHTSIPVINPTPELLAAKEKHPEQLYFNSDTHWNHLGAYIGTRTLMRELTPEIPVPELGTYSIQNRRDYYGDLWRLINATSRVDDNYFPEIPGVNFDTERYVVGHRLTLDNPEAPGGRLMMLRDSYSFYMTPYLGKYFKRVDLVTQGPLPVSLIEQTKPEIVVFEVLERFLDRLFPLADLLPEQPAEVRP